MSTISMHCLLPFVVMLLPLVLMLHLHRQPMPSLPLVLMLLRPNCSRYAMTMTTSPSAALPTYYHPTIAIASKNWLPPP